MADVDDTIVIDESQLENEVITELESQLLKEPIPVPTTLDTVIIVDCLPVVGPDKLEKLKKVVKRAFTVNAKITIDPDKIHMPMDNTTKKTFGYAFVELNSLEEVSEALTKMDQYKLDKKHIFIVNRFSDIERMEEINEKYEPPAVPEYKPKPNLRWWLSDRREQYAIMYAKETEVYWHEPIKPQPELITKKSMADYFNFQWSTYGSYYSIIVRGGRVLLLGGPEWKVIHTFDHHGVESVLFSPQERFLTTYLSEKVPNDKEFFTFWDISTGKKLRSFPRGNFFKWSHDDKYFARMTENKISIYEAPSCNLLEKKSLAIANVESFEWSPSKNVISIFIQGQNNTPSFLSLIEIPSRRELYRKSLFSVKNCTMTWQSEGRFLCLQVDRFKKNKKAIITSFEIFNLEAKIVTTEILTMKDTVKLFAWEPNGTRFGIIHGPLDSPIVSVSFYQISKKKLELKNTLEKRAAQKLFWSPRGSYLVIGGKNGSLEFYNAAMNEVMSESDHYMVSNLYWDPTGRYVCTFVSAWKMQLENGYVIRTFKGDVVHKVLKDQFYDFQWRPRPPSLLSKEKEAEIRKNLKNYAAKYKEEDDGLIGVIVDAKYKEQQRLLQEYAERMRAYAEQYQREREDRIRIRGVASDDESDFVEVESFEERVVDEQEEELI